MDECARMACSKDAVALLTFSPPEAKAWLYDLIDANPATGIMLCRKHANATVVPMSWQLVDSRDPAWSPPGEPAAPQPEPAAIPGLLTDETTLTEPLVDPAPLVEHRVEREPSYDAAPLVEHRVEREPSYDAAPEPAMATILSTTVHRHTEHPHVAVPQPNQPPAAVIPTVTAPSSAAAMPASPMAGTAAAAVVAPALPDPHLDPPVVPVPRRAETIRIEARPDQRVSHVVSLNEQIAAYGRQVDPQSSEPSPHVVQWVEPKTEPAPPVAADLVANIQERLLPDPSLFELPLDAPAVTPHHGYR